MNMWFVGMMLLFLGSILFMVLLMGEYVKDMGLAAALSQCKTLCIKEGTRECNIGGLVILLDENCSLSPAAAPVNG